MRRIDHLHLGRSPTPGQFAKQVLPQPSTRPAHKAVINGCRRAIFGRAIAPAASALENMHDPADDPAIVYPLDAAHIPRQIRPNSSPLLVAQPKQILAHDPDPLPKTNQDRILRAQMLMSFDPSTICVAMVSAKKSTPTNSSSISTINSSRSSQSRPRSSVRCVSSVTSLVSIPRYSAI